MPQRNNRQFETFKDGVLELCEVEQRKLKRTIEELRFADKTIGIHRAYEAKIAGEVISRLVSVPYRETIHSGDVALINGQQYEIGQVQVKTDKQPKHLYLTLKRSPVKYADERIAEYGTEGNSK